MTPLSVGVLQCSGVAAVAPESGAAPAPRSAAPALVAPPGMLPSLAAVTAAAVTRNRMFSVATRGAGGESAFPLAMRWTPFPSSDDEMPAYLSGSIALLQVCLWFHLTAALSDEAERSTPLGMQARYKLDERFPMLMQDDRSLSR